MPACRCAEAFNPFYEQCESVLRGVEALDSEIAKLEALCELKLSAALQCARGSGGGGRRRRQAAAARADAARDGTAGVRGGRSTPHFDNLDGLSLPPDPHGQTRRARRSTSALGSPRPVLSTAPGGLISARSKSAGEHSHGQCCCQSAYAIPSLLLCFPSLHSCLLTHFCLLAPPLLSPLLSSVLLEVAAQSVC